VLAARRQGSFSGPRITAHVLSILDDYSRAIVAVHVANAEDIVAAITVFQKAAGKYGLPDRFQFDRGSAFDSHAFRAGIARLGVHRNAVKAKNLQAQGKIESYHRSLSRWFVVELKAQEVIDLEHLGELCDALIQLVYKRGVGALQKLVDVWQGKERPNAQPGFGLPEVFLELSALIGRPIPNSEREGRDVLTFYRRFGPLACDPFREACRRTKAALGQGRPLSAYLNHLERQILSDARQGEADEEEVAS